MTFFRKIRKISLLLPLMLIISFPSHSQDLLRSRKTSYYTYIYRITNEEAGRIYKKIFKQELWKTAPSFFHTLVDSFPTDSQYCKRLTAGHYLRTYAEKNTQKLSITTVRNFNIYLFNNNTDLCLQVFDLQGNPVSDADVHIRRKKLSFDKETQAYTDKKSNKKGILTVSRNGLTAYYDLARQYNNSGIRRGTRKVVYSPPVKYIWLPVRFIISLPVDAVMSAVRGWPQGTIGQTGDFFVKISDKITCLFNHYYCDLYGNRFRKRHTGYLVFNKPKYMPGDTVKLKAFLETKKGKPVSRTVSVILRNNRKNIELTRLRPYRPGGYEYSFYLHDSLHLQLDKRYTIRIRKNDRKEYISGSFRYEDYELTKNTLSISTGKKVQYRHDPLRLFVRGTDENDLTLPDARLEILLTPVQTTRYVADHVFIPDTLLFLKKKLKPAGQTEILLRDSTFPPANFTYDIRVRMLTSDNEVLKKHERVAYYYETEKFNITTETDSILFEYQNNGRTQPREVSIFAEDDFGNKKTVYKGPSPCRIRLKPYYSSYTVQSDSLSGRIDIAREPSLLQCLSERTRDSVYVTVSNPRKLPFIYSIYRRNRERSSAYSDSLGFREKAGTKQNYFISIRYLWGGRVREENFRIPFKEDNLHIAVRAPALVYPGQKTKIELLVTNTEGDPVEGVDVTAFSITKNFHYAPPDLTFPVKPGKNKNVINNFFFKAFDPDMFSRIKLDYNTWKILAGIDTIAYFRFIYPGDSIYRFEYTPEDSVTQFAPFVISEGNVLPVYVIYVDSKPVFFRWSVRPAPYSFRIDSGYHQIKLRAPFRSIVIDSVYLTYGKKLIFSVDRDAGNRHIRSMKADNKLSDYEKHLLYRYIVPFRNTFGEHYAYLEQGKNIQLLNPELTRQRSGFAGPFAGDLTFHLLDSFSLAFRHEPFYEYVFRPGLLKMRCIDPKARYPAFLSSYPVAPSFADIPLTRQALEKKWEDYLDAKRYTTVWDRYPDHTRSGYGNLLIRLKTGRETAGRAPLNMLIVKYDEPDFLRVYPGRSTLVSDLSPGRYRLIFFYPGARYHIEDSLVIRPDGMNYYAFAPPRTLRKDTFSLYVSRLIRKTLFTSYPVAASKNTILRDYRRYQQQDRYTGPGYVVEGYVRDAESGEPLPGANVVIKGTFYGTVADVDGYYSINVPERYNVLEFSFVGYRTLEKTIGDRTTVNADLSPDLMALDEVVVTGYGSRKKKSLSAPVITGPTAAYSSAITDDKLQEVLQGSVAGLSIQNRGTSPGATEIQLRGAMSTLSLSAHPLVVINGRIYTGKLSAVDPSVISSIRILKGTEATSLYGSRGANGVILIKTVPGTFQVAAGLPDGKKGAYPVLFPEEAYRASSIRDNFSDYAFWQPALVTDRAGRAGFEVTFPDDVTSWRTFYLAMGAKRLSGQTEGLIRSYKPLMARLALPRFLVRGDTSYAIGKVISFLPDTTFVETKLEVNGTEIFRHSGLCRNALIDTLPVIAPADSLKVKYYLQTKDGYFDGELKDLPVFPQGLEETHGHFYVLDKDTSLEISADTSMGKVTLYARADILTVVEDEIAHLIHYKYYCNEQIASKLKALLAEKAIKKAKGEPFRKDLRIKKLIRILNRNRVSNGLWGWWKGSEESLWISLHVLEALTQAGRQGYKTSLDREKITERMVWELENRPDFSSAIRILRILVLLEAQVNYPHYISLLEKDSSRSLNDLLKIMALKQRCHLDPGTDTLRTFMDTTLFGNYYFSDDDRTTDLFNNDVQNTLLAYQILRADSTTVEQVLRKMRNYFLEKRKNGYWRNTYESAGIIETILPDLLKERSGSSHPVLKIAGDTSLTVTKFPFKMETDPHRKIRINRSGNYPVYLTSWQKSWNPSPAIKGKDFEITTSFEDSSSSLLTAGKETKLIARVKVKKDADYVMINIPVPGGCSYANKKNRFSNESHREYFKNETTIFCSHLYRGEYTFEIALIPRYSGTYTLNPAKIELMYFPTFNANNKIKKVTIIHP